MWQGQSEGNFQNADDMGGFMKSPGSQSSQQPNAVKSWHRPHKNVFPVTVSDLNSGNFKDDSFCIMDQKVSMVTLVGIVRSVQRQSNHNIYEVDDHTGPWLRVIQWLEDMDESDPEYIDETMVINTYVRIFGTLRNMTGDIHLVTFTIFPITSYSDITHHMVQVVLAKKHHEKLQNAADGGGNMSLARENTTSGHGADPGNDARVVGMTPLQKKVFRHFQDYAAETGCPVQVMVQQLKISMKDLRATIDFLHREGHIYSTIDDDHYKATD